MSEKFIARIVPAQSGANHAAATSGTKVFVGDKELSGITKIVLTATAQDCWRAEIHCYVQTEEMRALAELVVENPPVVVEATDMTSVAREYEVRR